MDMPPIVGEEEWQRSHEELLAREKEATRAADALAAERRRAPMKEVSTEFGFEGPEGEVGFLDLFEGRPQLILYHFWFPPEGDPCRGCSMVGDQISNLAHLNARDTTFAFVSTGAPGRDAGLRGAHGLGDPLVHRHARVPGGLRHDRIVRLRRLPARRRPRLPDLPDRGRGVEAIGTVWSFLDRTPLGRQEEWEDTPPGRPQTPPYGWWEYHDEY